MLTTKKQRLDALDYVKTVAMLQIVAGHTQIQISKVISPMFGWVYVAVFFVCSGFFLNTDYDCGKDRMQSQIIKCFKRYYIPFVLFQLFFIALHNLLIDEGWFYQNLDHYLLVIKHTFLMDVTESMVAPNWFLTSLTIAILIWTICHTINCYFWKYDQSLPKSLIRITLLLVVLFVSQRPQNAEDFLLPSSFMNSQILKVSMSAAFFLELGVWTRKLICSFEKRKYTLTVFGILAFIVLLVLEKCYPFYSVNVREHMWQNIFMHIPYTVLNTIFLYALGVQLIKIKPIKIVSQYVAKHSLWIMALHMFSFFLFDKGITLLGLSVYSTAYGYCKILVALLLPILIHLLFNVLAKQVKSGYNNLLQH